MFYTIYQTTNIINNKKYIGKHETKTLDDNYLGSGILLKSAIKKYGKENFRREYLFVFDNEKEMILKEQELITKEIIKSDEYYNIAFGGTGGCIVLKKEHPLYEQTIEKIRFTNKNNSENISKRMKQMYKDGAIPYMKGRAQSEYQKEMVRKTLTGKPKTAEAIEKQKISYAITVNSPEYIHPNTGKNKTQETKDKISLNHRNMRGANNHMYGNKHTAETKAKISERQKNMPNISCQYCEISTTRLNIQRWHNENCKRKS